MTATMKITHDDDDDHYDDDKDADDDYDCIDAA